MALVMTEENITFVYSVLVKKSSPYYLLQRMPFIEGGGAAGETSEGRGVRQPAQRVGDYSFKPSIVHHT